MLCGIVAGAFTILMIIFRPEQYAQLLKAEEERKARSREQMGKVLGGAFTLGKWLWKLKK
jgi:hypothetical protein